MIRPHPTEAYDTLESEARAAGCTTIQQYVCWLEDELLWERKRRDELFATNNLELERKRAAEHRAEIAERIANPARALMRKWRAGGPYWQEMQDLKAAVKAEETVKHG